MRVNNPPAEFRDWVLGKGFHHPYRRQLVATELLAAVGKSGSNVQGPQALAQVEREVNTHINKGDTTTFALNHSFHEKQVFTIAFEDAAQTPPDIVLSLQVPTRVILRNLRIRELQVAAHLEIDAQNCWVGHMTFSGAHRAILDLDNCWIGRLDLSGLQCLGRTQIRCGGLFNIVCPPLTAGSPFTDHFRLSRRHICLRSR